jgi:hypothetical protein
VLPSSIRDVNPIANNDTADVEESNAGGRILRDRRDQGIYASFGRY